MKIDEIKTLERGWGGHFCCAERCLFRRNTLVGTYPDCIIVSTVGNYFEKPSDNEPTTIGINRYYETYMFEAKIQDEYIDADVNEQILFVGKSAIDHFSDGVDNEANDMHESAVLTAKHMLSAK